MVNRVEKNKKVRNGFFPKKFYPEKPKKLIFSEFNQVGFDEFVQVSIHYALHI